MEQSTLMNGTISHLVNRVAQLELANAQLTTYVQHLEEASKAKEAAEEGATDADDTEGAVQD